MTVLLVGAFSDVFSSCNIADSPAANQVQVELLENLGSAFSDESVAALSLQPVQAWPRGQLVVPGRQAGSVHYPTLINLPLIKMALFATYLFWLVRKTKPRLIVKYNVSLSEAMVLRLLKSIDRRLKVALILQDIDFPQKGIRAPLGLMSYIAAYLAAQFDVLIPVTEQIAKDFRYERRKLIVFPGGISRQTRAIAARSKDIHPRALTETAVFAGALEAYNGIDRLVDCWISDRIPMTLHVYGKGSLAEYVATAALASDNVRYWGHRPEHEVTEALCHASVNFCLRFPLGIREAYFFPSKFFNVSAAPGYVICNRFKNFPSNVEHLYGMVTDDFSNLKELILDSNLGDQQSLQKQRIRWLLDNCQWSVVVRALKALVESKNSGESLRNVGQPNVKSES